MTLSKFYVCLSIFIFPLTQWDYSHQHPRVSSQLFTFQFKFYAIFRERPLHQLLLIRGEEIRDPVPAKFNVVIGSQTWRHCQIKKKKKKKKKKNLTLNPTMSAKNTKLFPLPDVGRSLKIFVYNVFSFTHNAVVLYSVDVFMHPEKQMKIFRF